MLELGRQCERFLVLLSLDARFYLAAGQIGSGARWTPSPAAFDLFVAATYYFAAYDLTGGRFERIGTWRYTCLSHLGAPMPGTAATKPQAVGSTEAT